MRDENPIQRTDLTRNVAAAVPRNGKSPAPTRILVVDDNLVNRKVAQKQLERLGYLVDAVDGGEPALAAMASAQYPVVLLGLRHHCRNPAARKRRSAHHHNRDDRACP
jgi:PleD family two-component response regulator